MIMPQALSNMQNLMFLHAKISLDMTNQILKVSEVSQGFFEITQWAGKSLAKGTVINVRYRHEFETQPLEFAHCVDGVREGRPGGDAIGESYTFSLQLIISQPIAQQFLCDCDICVAQDLVVCRSWILGLKSSFVFGEDVTKSEVIFCTFQWRRVWQTVSDW
ncbi:hypothetical protein TMatcc_000474 [Talaromyces marneffei ATCC 18224]